MPPKNWHLPSASIRTKSQITVAADLQYTLKGVQGRVQEWGTLYFRKKLLEEAFR